MEAVRLAGEWSAGPVWPLPPAAARMVPAAASAQTGPGLARYRLAWLAELIR
jgi:hypothetical protein